MTNYRFTNLYYAPTCTVFTDKKSTHLFSKARQCSEALLGWRIGIFTQISRKSNVDADMLSCLSTPLADKIEEYMEGLPLKVITAV